MREFATRLARLGPVSAFDYPYQLAGRRAPDRTPVLVGAHREAFAALRAAHSEPAVLIGKSMGSRMGCHLAVELAENGPRALVCLGYPLVGQNGSVRDEVLRALRTPVLFVQGTRDSMCPLAQLEKVRASMQAPNELYVVDGGDHSLGLLASALKAKKVTQAAIADGVIDGIGEFLKRH